MSAEVDVSSPLDRYECRVCGYQYEPTKGDNRSQIPGGTAFKDLPEDWLCPVCGAAPSKFKNVGPAGKPSGFEENLRYGIGVNTLTPGQKNILIFSVLGALVLLLLSFYGFS
ncbi:rubredoxin [Lyngbya confervoides]|uniref:Rubredoxin n=1 Tax=Lyngbya confervoides BDU141951 TaxID=1574623 RepID=A0ABD4T9Z0_9CYAN|nr:rubredoxin [Lyngbya confervoides]MCM1985342.1 rubredoxin [Lyngbya confervoides BDU141951]